MQDLNTEKIVPEVYQKIDKCDVLKDLRVIQKDMKRENGIDQ